MIASIASISKFARYGLILLVYCSIAKTANADTLAKIRQTHSITIAYREASVPFSYISDNKKPIGYSVDLCLKIVDAVRRELKLQKINVMYVPVISSNRIPAIVEGKADLECGSTTNNAERRTQVAFTIPHFVATVRMLVRSNSGISNWPDLRGKRVAATKGTTTIKLLTERYKVRPFDFKLIEASNDTESFSMVEKGTAEAFPMDDVLLYGLRANAKDPGSFVIVGDSLSAEPYAIMLRKDDAPFKALVDREMVRIFNDGELVKLYDKWFKRPIPPKGINMNMPMSHLLRDILRFPTDRVGD